MNPLSATCSARGCAARSTVSSKSSKVTRGHIIAGIP